VRVVALITSYNERRFIGPCLEHLYEQGVESYLIDNGSTDETVEIAEQFLDRGLIAIEEFPLSKVLPDEALPLPQRAARGGRSTWEPRRRHCIAL